MKSERNKDNTHKHKTATSHCKRDRRTSMFCKSNLQRQSKSEITLWNRETGTRGPWFRIPRNRIHRRSKVTLRKFHSYFRNEEKGFKTKYETLTRNVVPRSSQKLAQDEEFSLYTVTLFRRDIPEFSHRCRELKYPSSQFIWSKMDPSRFQVQWHPTQWRNSRIQPSIASRREVMGMNTTLLFVDDRMN